MTITSTKQKKINGKNSDSPITVQYSRSNSGTGVSGSGTNITMSRNSSTSSRSGSVKFTQSESGKTVTVNLSQSAATKNVITCEVGIQQGVMFYTLTAQYAVKSKVSVTYIFNNDSSRNRTVVLEKGKTSVQDIWQVGGSILYDDVQLSVNYESSDNYVYEAKKGWG